MLPVAFAQGTPPVGVGTRSVLVTLTLSDALGGAMRSFSARARLREDLSVGEWFVLDAPLPASVAAAPTLPRFAACSASPERVTSPGSPLQLQWSFAAGESPDEVLVRWSPPGAQAQLERLSGAAVSVRVPAAFPASSPHAPVSVPYRIEAWFEGRVVDACVVDVVSGQHSFELLSSATCVAGDSVLVRWDVNAASGVRVVHGRLRQGSTALESVTVASRSSSGSVVIPAPAAQGVWNRLGVRLEGPSSLGLPRTIAVPLGTGC